MSRATKRRFDWKTMKARLRAAQTDSAQSSAVDDARVRTIFHNRAQQLAAGIREAGSTKAASPVLVFGAGCETYGIELRHIVRIFPDSPITPVPGAPEILAGVANLQGEVRSVIGLRRLLGMSGDEDEASRCILLLRQESRRVGLQVERLDGVRQIALNDLSEPRDAPVEQHADYVLGVTRDKVIMLRADRLFDC